MEQPGGIPRDIWDAADGATNRISGELVKALTEGSEATADGLIQAHVARAIMAERERAAQVCRKAAGYYDAGAGSAHSEEARRIGKSQANWCADEIMRGVY